MKLQPVKAKGPSIAWVQEQKTLTLTGEPVLELSLTRPVFSGEGPLIAPAERYYARVARRWAEHWSRERYIDACMELVLLREKSKNFIPWQCGLSGEITLNDGEYLSIRMEARERRGDNRVLCYRWGDVWRWADGAVVTLGELFSGRRHWRRSIHRQLLQAAERKTEEGTVFLPKWRRGLCRWCDFRRFALTGEAIELYCPQCTVAPAAEGALTFHLPRSKPENGS